MKRKISAKLILVTPNTSKAVNKPNEEKVISSGRRTYSFFDDVYDVVRQIPKGKVSSYGAIAAYIGTRLSARMVGWAMNGAHHINPKVPAQRVVNRNGMLTGKHHFDTPSTMEKLLKKDGLSVKNNTVVDFKKHFWDPSESLSL